MYSDPPLLSTSPMLWLPPNVWFQGNQSSSTGGSFAMKGMDCRSIAALLQHMRLVMITALGLPVEPDVSRNLTIESALVAARASSARVSSPSSSDASGDTWRPGSGESPMIATSDAKADDARAKRAVSNAAMRPGVSRSIAYRSLPRSPGTRE